MMGAGGKGRGGKVGRTILPGDPLQPYVIAPLLRAQQKSLETRAPTFDHAMWEGRKTQVVTERRKDGKMEITPDLQGGQNSPQTLGPSHDTRSHVPGISPSEHLRCCVNC